MYGLDHLEYISATSFGSGHMEIDLTFEQGTNPDIAQVQVQNKLQLAQPRLPTEVVTQGISVNNPRKAFSSSPLSSLRWKHVGAGYCGLHRFQRV